MATAKKDVNYTNSSRTKNKENGNSNNLESIPDQVNIIKDTSSNSFTANQQIQIIDPNSGPSPVEWLTMFQKLNNMIEGVQRELIEICGTKQKVKSLITNQGLQQEMVVELTHNVKNCHMRMDIMVNTVIRQEEQIVPLKREVVDLQNMRKNILISGIVEEIAEMSDQCIQKVQDFIQDKLQAHDEIEIKTAHHMGIQKGNRPMVAKLKNIDDKKKIFDNASNWKDEHNEKGRMYFLSDQQPEELAEERREIRDTLMESRQDTTPNRIRDESS